MNISRLSPDEFVDKMRTSRHWAVNMNRAVMELQLTVCTPADIFENWFGPDPRDMTDEEHKAFTAKVERARRIYCDRELQDIVPDGGYPVRFRVAMTPVLHRERHLMRKIRPEI